MIKASTVITVLAVLSLSACEQSTKTSSSTKNVSATKPVSVKLTDSPKASQTIEDNFPADSIHYPLEILLPGIFHDGEADPKLAPRHWKGLFKADSSYYIADTRLSILRAHDDIVDDEGQNTGWDVETTVKYTAILLVSGLKDLNNKKVSRIAIAKDQLLPGEQESFIYKNIRYTLYATGTKKAEPANSGIYAVSSYKLFLKATIDGKPYDQLLVSATIFDDTLSSILFVGDIDDDGIPDLIINTTTDYNSEVPTLYLSKPAAGSNNLLKVMGMHSFTGC